MTTHATTCDCRNKLQVGPWIRAVVRYPREVTDLGRDVADVTIGDLNTGCLWRLDDGTYRVIRRSWGPGGLDLVSRDGTSRFASESDALDALSARLRNEHRSTLRPGCGHF